uniref:Uncharacterized protein n=1 Tax=Anguilla anguilla TaxID=7936 RepID=A0A0E9PK48_ANGAN
MQLETILWLDSGCPSELEASILRPVTPNEDLL